MIECNCKCSICKEEFDTLQKYWKHDKKKCMLKGFGGDNDEDIHRRACG
jgi:hypothetical protein